MMCCVSGTIADHLWSRARHDGCERVMMEANAYLVLPMIYGLVVCFNIFCSHHALHHLILDEIAPELPDHNEFLFDFTVYKILQIQELLSWCGWRVAGGGVI